MVKAHNDNVRVLVRVRPFNQKEINEVGGVCPPCTLSVPSDTLISCIDPSNPDIEHTFAFDYVFWSMPPEQVTAPVPFAGQEEVYEQVGVPQLDSMFEGYNGCIFAYGQTSSGKTHSMMGFPGKGRGITPRLCEELFSRIESKQQMTDSLKKTTYSVKVSFLEIYNEKVQDLLSKKGSQLQIVHDPLLGPVVRGLTEHPVSGWHEVERLLDRGMENRSTAATAMNDRSSRSHAVVQISLDMEDSLGLVGNKAITRPRRSRANLVDLAGSEKVSKSKVEGANLKEAIGINQSLTCLGRVIDGLVEQKPHIPYRDSVLTCLLQDSLGGNSRTTMLAALSPAAVNHDETLSTLRYAARARKVVNKVKINEDPAAALIRELQEELERMRHGVISGDFEGMGHGQRAAASSAEVEARTAEVQEALAKLQELQEREDQAEQERENKWQAERDRIEHKHHEAMENLRREQEQLTEQKRRLEEQHSQMTADIKQKRQLFTVQKLRHGAQISMEKQKRQQTEVQAAKLKSNLLREKFIKLAGKARLIELNSEGNEEKAVAHKRLAEVLERDLRETRDAINYLETLPDFIPAEGAELYDAEGRLLGPDGFPLEEVVYDGPLCDMCQEQPAQFRCLHPPCHGDLYCIWCDANQHRYEYKDHDRMPIAMPCECCGTREAEIVCPGCDGARMCRICDDAHHNRHTRTMIFGLPCHFCGLRDAQVECFDCPSRLCPACDELKHRSGRRVEHRRQFLENPLAVRTLRIEGPKPPPVEPYPHIPETAASARQYAIEYYPPPPGQQYPAAADPLHDFPGSAPHTQAAHDALQSRPANGVPQTLPHTFPGSRLSPQASQRPPQLDVDSATRNAIDLARERAYVAAQRPALQVGESPPVTQLPGGKAEDSVVSVPRPSLVPSVYAAPPLPLPIMQSVPYLAAPLGLHPVAPTPVHQYVPPPAYPVLQGVPLTAGPQPLLFQPRPLVH